MSVSSLTSSIGIYREGRALIARQPNVYMLSSKLFIYGCEKDFSIFHLFSGRTESYWVPIPVPQRYECT